MATEGWATLTTRAADTGPNWLTEIREKAKARLDETGLPTRRDEGWRYTSLTPVIENNFHLPEKAKSLAIDAPAGLQCHHITFVDGLMLASTSSVEGLTSLADALTGNDDLSRFFRFDTNAFGLLNALHVRDGLLLRLEANQAIQQPILVTYVNTGQGVFANSRLIVEAAANSRATIIERFVSSDNESNALVNHKFVAKIGDGAQINHFKWQGENSKSYHFYNLVAELRKDSTFSNYNVSNGGAITRNDLNVYFEEEGGEATLNGAYMLAGGQHIDNQTSVRHEVAHCNSSETYHGILDGQSMGVFNGRVYVEQDAQQTNADQLKRTLLLSGDAQVAAKPQLEIYADDVKCSHGATIGQLSDEAYFYLRSRGISPDVARRLLVEAFATAVLDMCEDETLRAAMKTFLLLSESKGRTRV